MRTGIVVALCILLFLLGMLGGSLGTVFYMAWRDQDFGNAQLHLMERERAVAERRAAEVAWQQEKAARIQAEEACRRAEEALKKIREADPAKD